MSWPCRRCAVAARPHEGASNGARIHRGELPPCRGRPAGRSVRRRRAQASHGLERSRPDLPAVDGPSGHHDPRPDRARRPAQPDADVVRLRGRQGAGEHRLAPAEMRMDSQAPAAHRPAGQSRQPLPLDADEVHGGEGDAGVGGTAATTSPGSSTGSGPSTPAIPRPTPCATRRSTRNGCCSSAGSTASRPSASRKAACAQAAIGGGAASSRSTDRRPAAGLMSTDHVIGGEPSALVRRQR